MTLDIVLRRFRSERNRKICKQPIFAVNTTINTFLQKHTSVAENDAPTF